MMESEGDTSKLYVVDIPLEATMTDCMKVFKTFGKIKRFEFYPNKGPHEGRAFIDFFDPECGKQCLEKAQRSKSSVSDRMLFGSGLAILESPIVVMVQKDRQTLIDKRNEKVKDKRNIELMYEGHITVNDEAANGVNPEELAKRKKLFDSKLTKLNDVNNKVSRTRLAVFNLPRTCGPGQIRKIFAIAPQKYQRTHKSESISKIIKKNPVRITEVRKSDKQDDVAFVEFKLHEHALGALREVNNNPHYFHDRRLIVEFAIENNFKTMKMRKKQMRSKKFAKSQPAERGGDEEDFEVAEESE